MGRPLVVVRPGIVGAEGEWALGDEDVAACLDLGRSQWRRAGQRAELERLRHRLDVLELVLGDHPDDEAVSKQRVSVVDRELWQEPEHALAHLGHVFTRGSRREDREASTLGARMSEGVVEAIAVRRSAVLSSDAPQQPQLLEVADMREIPDERRLQRRDLRRELVVGERLQQSQRAVARVPESNRKLRRRHRAPPAG
jgi:hypothetical protein